MGWNADIRGPVYCRPAAIPASPALALGLVPEGRQIFPTLTVEENLIATATGGAAAPRWTLDRMWTLFPKPA